MLSVPKAKVVRGYSFYGFSFVYVIFEDGTDPYWARSRVLEYLSGLSGQLPKASRRRSARTPPASAGRSCIPSTPPTATWPNCARCRTGI
jgi:Cu/Ag efflux pump CusA